MISSISVRIPYLLRAQRLGRCDAGSFKWAKSRIDSKASPTLSGRRLLIRDEEEEVTLGVKPPSLNIWTVSESLVTQSIFD